MWRNLTDFEENFKNNTSKNIDGKFRWDIPNNFDRWDPGKRGIL
jgi:hypothetical protein